MKATSATDISGWPAAMLLALLREDDEALARLARAGGDWDALVALARQRGVSGYLGSVWAGRPARELLPAAVRDALNETRRRTAYENTLVLAGARPVLQRFVDAGITPLVLKGAALVGRVYSDPGARGLTDIDVLVPHDRADEARRLLVEHGLAHRPGDQKEARRTEYHMAAGDLAVDIHWDLSQRYRYQAGSEGLWARSVELDLDGIPVRRLGDTDEFLYLCLHYAAHYFGQTLKWLADLRELVRSGPPDPGELAGRAREWRGTAALHFAMLYLLKVYPDLPYPESIDRHVARPARDRLIRPYLSDDPLLYVSERRRGAARHLMGLLFIDRPVDMLRLGWVTLIK